MKKNKRIVFMGDQYVGKTSLINKFLNKYVDYSIYSPTNGIDLSIYKTLNTKYFLWDTSGDTRFRYIINTYAKKADLIVIVYDLSNIKNSVENLKKWIENVKKENNNVKIITIGNKKDKIQYCETEVLEFKRILFKQSEISQNILKDIENDDIDETFSNIFESVYEEEIIHQENEEKEIKYFEKSSKKRDYCCFCF